MNEQFSEETIFLDGESYFKSLLCDIALAKHCIDLETYIFESDVLGHQVADALIAAAQRNVNIRVLVDGAGTPNWGGALTKKIEKAGIVTRVFHPFPWRLWQWRRAVMRRPFLLKIIYFLSKVNARNHRKICMIDKEIVYIGSANVSHCHLNEKNNGKNWRDTIIKLIKINITDLEAAFESVWNHTPIQERIHNIFESVDPNAIIRLNNTRHRRRVLYKNLLRRLSRCKNRVWITNAYFVPDNFLLKKLNDLAGAGVDVRILLPQKSDIFIMPWATTTFYESLLKSGARIFEYRPSMLHAKTLILDDWFSVGSSNLNYRSLLHDLEVDVNIKSLPVKQKIEQQFLEDLSFATEIQIENWHKRTFFQKMVGRMVLYIKYWI